MPKISRFKRFIIPSLLGFALVITTLLSLRPFGAFETRRKAADIPISNAVQGSRLFFVGPQQVHLGDKFSVDLVLNTTDDPYYSVSQVDAKINTYPPPIGIAMSNNQLAFDSKNGAVLGVAMGGSCSSTDQCNDNAYCSPDKICDSPNCPPQMPDSCQGTVIGNHTCSATILPDGQRCSIFGSRTKGYCWQGSCQTAMPSPTQVPPTPTSIAPSPTPIPTTTICIPEGKEGNGINGDSCCAGLIGLGIYSPPSCVETSNGGFICVNCGNGICGPGENYCNCPQDCKPPSPTPTPIVINKTIINSATLKSCTQLCGELGLNCSTVGLDDWAMDKNSYTNFSNSPSGCSTTYPTDCNSVMYQEQPVTMCSGNRTTWTKCACAGYAKPTISPTPTASPLCSDVGGDCGVLSKCCQGLVCESPVLGLFGKCVNPPKITPTPTPNINYTGGISLSGITNGKIFDSYSSSGGLGGVGYLLPGILRSRINVLGIADSQANPAGDSPNGKFGDETGGCPMMPTYSDSCGGFVQGPTSCPWVNAPDGTSCSNRDSGKTGTCQNGTCTYGLGVCTADASQCNPYATTNECCTGSVCYTNSQYPAGGVCGKFPAPTPIGSCTDKSQCLPNQICSRLCTGNICGPGTCVTVSPTPTPVGSCTDTSQCKSNEVCLKLCVDNNCATVGRCLPAPTSISISVPPISNIPTPIASTSATPILPPPNPNTYSITGIKNYATNPDGTFRGFSGKEVFATLNFVATQVGKVEVKLVYKDPSATDDTNILAYLTTKPAAGQTPQERLLSPPESFVVEVLPPAPPSPTPTIDNKISWHTSTVSLDADSLSINAGNKIFTGKPDPGTPPVSIHSDPGNSTYTTLEATWIEQGIEMRLYLYFAADQNNWWASEMRTYDGQKQGDWIFYKNSPGIYFRQALGKNVFYDKIVLSSPDSPPYLGQVNFSNLKLQGFVKSPTVTPIQCKTGVNTFSVSDSCNDNGQINGSRKANWTCYDGTTGESSVPSPYCSSYDYWRQTAENACTGKSSCDITPTANPTPSPTPYVLTDFCKQVQANVGESSNDINWNANKQYDLNSDGIINGLDVILCIQSGR